MDVEIVPEPTPEERRAILAALAADGADGAAGADGDPYASPWRRAGLPGGGGEVDPPQIAAGPRSSRGATRA